MKTLRSRFAPPARTPGWQPDTVRGTRQQRGYGAAWERLRADVMHRDLGLCQPCLKAGHVTTATAVDHVTSKAEARSLGWTNAQIDDPQNLQAICDACHRTKTASESRRGGG